MMTDITDYKHFVACEETKKIINGQIDSLHAAIVVNTIKSFHRAGWLTKEALTTLKQAGIL